MMKTLIAAAAALSLATAPVQANEFNEEDFGKFLFGLVAAIAVGAALTKNNDKPAVQPREVYEPPVVRHRPNNTAPRINPGHRAEPPVVRHQPRNAPPIGHTPRWQSGGFSKVLPGRCFQRIDTRFGRTNLFGKWCLEQHYRHAARLPAQCAVRVIRADGEPRNGFDPLCLRQNGFRSSRG